MNCLEVGKNLPTLKCTIQLEYLTYISECFDLYFKCFPFIIKFLQFIANHNKLVLHIFSGQFSLLMFG